MIIDTFMEHFLEHYESVYMREKMYVKKPTMFINML